MTSGSVSAADESAIAQIGIDLSSQEYETQYFGWTPKSFSDGMYNAVLQYTYETFSAAQVFIKSEFPKHVTDEQLHKAETQTFFPKINRIIDRAFDKFEIYLLTNIFHIPQNVVLPEDQMHEKHGESTAEEEAALDEELNKLKQNIVNKRYMNEVMRSEIKQLEKVIRLYEEFDHFQSTLDKLLTQAGVSDMKESLIFYNEKTQRILSVLNRLQNQGSSSEHNSHTDDSENLPPSDLQISDSMDTNVIS